MFENINEISVLVAAILAAAVGSIWYSPLLFGSVWTKSARLTEEEIELSKKQMISATVKGISAQVVFFFVIAKYITLSNQNSISVWSFGGILVMLLVTHMLQSVIWEKRSIAYFCIQIGYTALSVFGGAAIISFWPW